jgi:hypothetical protein
MQVFLQRIFFLTAFLLLTVPIMNAKAETFVRDITTDTTFTKEGSPYIVEGEVDVSPTATLTIEPGAQVTAQYPGSPIWFNLYGKLKAVGTPEDRITINNVQIRGMNSPNNQLQIEYATIEFKSPRTFTMGMKNGLTIKNSTISNGEILFSSQQNSVLIENNYFTNQSYLTINNGAAPTLIKGNTFHTTNHFFADIELRCNGDGCNASNTVITENNFFSPDYFYVKFWDSFPPKVVLNGTNNYWGTINPKIINGHLWTNGHLNLEPFAYKPFNNGYPFGELQAPIVNLYGDADTVLSGKTDADSTVHVWKDGALAVEGTSNAEGFFQIPLTEPAGIELIVRVTDSYKRTSADTKISVIDNSAPGMPEVDEVNDKSTSITGKAEPLTDIKVKTAEGSLVGSTTTDDSGRFYLNITKLTAGTTLEIRATDPAGNTSQPAVVTVLKRTAPTVPVLANMDVTENTTSISGNAEPFTIVKVYKGETEIASAKTMGSGLFNLTIPKQKAYAVLSIVAVDEAGNRSKEVTVTVRDVTAPTIVVDNDFMIYDNATEVTGFSEPGAFISIIKNGQTLATATVKDDGRFTIPIPLLHAGSGYFISVSDKTGNTAFFTLWVLDRTPPAAAIINKITTSSTEITGTAEPETIIDVKIGPDIFTGNVGADGRFNISIPAQKAGTTIIIKVFDVAGNYSPITEMTVVPDYKGWVQLGSTWYYFDNVTGIKKTGWFLDSGKWYYFNAEGSMQKGWVLSNKNWYYLSGSGVMLSGWQKVGNTWYYFSRDGVMKTSWLKDAGKWYYFNNNGSMQTGWLQSGSKWYYFNKSGAMATGRVLIGKKYFMFNSSGVLVK